MSDLVNYLPGIPEVFGVKSPAPAFAQGRDITIDVTLLVDGNPITNFGSNWSIRVYVKKSERALTILWQGPVTYIAGNIYNFLIPAADNLDTMPGSYYYTVAGTYDDPIAGYTRELTLASGMFEVTLDSSSPNPKIEQWRSSTELTEPEGSGIPTANSNDYDWWVI